jgi:Pectate lyase superfamily protein
MKQPFFLLLLLFSTSLTNISCNARKKTAKTTTNTDKTPAEDVVEDAAATPAFARPANCTPPSRYSQFTLVRTAAELTTAVNNPDLRYIALAPGTYDFKKEPLRINRQTCLYIHGFNRKQTILMSGTAAIVVENCPLLSLAGLAIHGSEKISKAVWFKQSKPIVFEMQDGVLSEAQMTIDAPGNYRFQGLKMYSGGAVNTNILVNHKAADVLVQHVDFLGGSKERNEKDVCHAHQLAGRLRIYSFQAENAKGQYEFLFESKAAQGCHVIAGCRSEGNNSDSTACNQAIQKAFIGVFGEKTAILVKANSVHGYQGLACRKRNVIVEMNSTNGKLWLLGNNSRYRAGRAVSGTDPKPQILALGNITANTTPDGDAVVENSSPFPILKNSNTTLSSYFNQYHRLDLARRVRSKFLNNETPKLLTQVAATMPIPEEDLPLVLELPSLDTDFEGLFLNVKTFGARGDGKTDDTNALQTAFAAAIGTAPKYNTCLVYFPKGNYRITKPLSFYEPAALGGFIGGADSSSVRIINTATSTALRVGAWGFTVQGIGFSLPKTSSTCLNGLVEIDALTASKSGCPTAQVFFRKCAFRNGEIGVAIGNRNSEREGDFIFLGSNTDMCLFENCIFAQNQTGMSVSFFNSLMQGVTGCTFLNNTYGIRNFGKGSYRETEIEKGKKVLVYQGAGTWYVHHSTFKNTKVHDFEMINAISGVYFFYNIQSNAQKNTTTYNGLEPHIYFYEKSTFSNKQYTENTRTIVPEKEGWCMEQGANGFNISSSPECFCFNKAGGGLFFLHSDLSKSSVLLPTDGFQKYLILAQSKAPCKIKGGNVLEYNNQTEISETTATPPPPKSVEKPKK